MVIDADIAVYDEAKWHAEAHAREIEGVGVVNGHISSTDHGLPVKPMATPTYDVRHVDEETDDPDG